MPGGFTPNGSVKWFVDTPQSKSEGKDNSVEEHQFFSITIRLPSNPENRERFLTNLARDVERARKSGAASLTLCLPVEDLASGYTPPDDKSENYNPKEATHWWVYVDWTSKVAGLPADLKDGWVAPNGRKIG